MSARIQPLLIEENPPPCCHQTSTPKSEVSGRSISWATSLTPSMMQKRLTWGQKNKKKNWGNTVFSDVAMFSLKGNRIKYHEKLEKIKNKSKKSEIFWGFRSFHGSNIMATLVSLNASGMAQVLEREVVKRIKPCDDTIQFLDTLVTQFSSKVMCKTLKKKFYSVWPNVAKDLSPLYHAWELVGEKVKDIPCSSKQEMISIVSGVWEKDLDVQFMCSKLISLLPQVIKSVIRWEGSYPMDNVQYVVTRSRNEGFPMDYCT